MKQLIDKTKINEVLERLPLPAQLSNRGYNPKKPGRISHHPLIAFVAELRMTVNFWLRSGNVYTTNNFYNFLANTFGRLEAKTFELLKVDAKNRIKELKEDLGADSFNVEDFFATEAALNIVMIGYNQLSLFRQSILNTKTQQQLKTLR